MYMYKGVVTFEVVQLQSVHTFHTAEVAPVVLLYVICMTYSISAKVYAFSSCIIYGDTN